MARSRLGPLAIESKLGDHPSQSSVWRAIHLKKQTAVAVKIFSVPFGGTPETRADFAAEWDQLKKLQHPSIVRCYGGGFDQNDAYLAYELVEGETLGAMLERRQRLSWESVLDMAEPLVDALEYLHRRSICHGRLQSDKIMFAGLSPVLLDVRLTRGSGPYRGNTPATAEQLAYRAPETLDDETATSPAADLYSLGAVMYRCLTGRPPVDGDSVDEVKRNASTVQPTSAASIVMDCPVWLDKLVSQMLQKKPAARPAGAAAVRMALAEVRRRAMSRTGVAEHVSSGFSPLQVTDQKDRDEARVLLGRHVVDLDDDQVVDDSSWYDKPWVLVSGLVVLLAILGYFMWPLGEDAMRIRAEELLAENTRNSMIQAKVSFLIPMQKKFPEGRHADWVRDQIEQVEMVEAEHVLSVKMKRNLPLSGEGERLYAEGQRFERFGDAAAALAQYRSIVTLLGDQDQYRPFVNLARRQIAMIEEEGIDDDEAANIISAKLAEARDVYRKGNVVGARQIWYSIVDLYGDNRNVAPLVEQAQARLAAASRGRE